MLKFLGSLIHGNKPNLSERTIGISAIDKKLFFKMNGNIYNITHTGREYDSTISYDSQDITAVNNKLYICVSPTDGTVSIPKGFNVNNWKEIDAELVDGGSF